jgi:Arc/MetJ family transcription regulator
MRLNIEIDDDLLAKAREYSGLPTTRAVVEAALRTLVRVEAGQRIRDMAGKVTWEGDLDDWRTDREFDADR